MSEETLDQEALLNRLRTAERRSKIISIGIALIVLAAVLPVFVDEVLLRAYRANVAGVPFGSYDDANRQLELWRKNLECTAAPPNWKAIEGGGKLDVRLCTSGDILVHLQKADGSNSYRWITAESLSKGE